MEGCPVTMEHYASSGPNQPVFLPACGHTFSRIAVRNIIVVAQNAAARNASEDPARGMVRCPMCSTVQPHLRVDDLKPNWDTIRRIEHFKSVRAAEEAAAAAAEVESTGTGASESSDQQTTTGHNGAVPSPLAALQVCMSRLPSHSTSRIAAASCHTCEVPSSGRRVRDSATVAPIDVFPPEVLLILVVCSTQSVGRGH